MPEDSTPGDTPQGRSVPLLWVDLETTPVLFANQLLVQHHGSEFIISVGQVTPPALIGTDEERRQALAALEFVPVRTVARVGLTAQRMTEFVRVMQENLSTYEQAKGLDERDEQR
jgi:hypothetical protein